MSSELFKLRGHVSPRTSALIGVGGILGVLALWEVVCRLGLISAGLLPAPSAVFGSFAELHFEDALIRNALFSLKINFLGYLEAFLVSVPLGFVIGLSPIFRELFRRPIDSLRFVPLTALTGLFIAWFGIGEVMKVQFLAFGIIVYLLPTVVQRVREVEQVYCDTVYTVGASKWQTIRTVFVPAVLSKISDDTRVLVAISWTYIIIAEMVNKSDGGIGALAFTAARQSRIDKVFALLLLIVCLGFIQDKLAEFLDRKIFPFKESQYD